MGLVKCPICELNYMDESQKCCEVCRRGKHGEPDPLENGVCPACGERPAMRGHELCIVCQKEQLRRQKLEHMASAVEDGEDIDLENDDLDDLNDIELDDDSDIPESEYEEIHRELGDDEDFVDDEDYDEELALEDN